MALFLALLAFPAWAEMGAVGSPLDAQEEEDAEAAPLSPVEESETPPPEEKKAETSKDEKKQAEAPQDPLLQIDFNQRRVNFDRALKKSVEESEGKSSGVIYNVVSYLPKVEGTPRQNARANRAAEAQANAVVEGLMARGVPSSRIRVTTQRYPDPPKGEETPNYHRVSVFAE